MLEIFNSKVRGFGIDLSDLSIKIINLKNKKGFFELSSFGRQEIPAGLIENGEIKKEDELIEIIKKAVKNVNKNSINTNHCVASLPETESFVRLVHLPLMDKKEITEAIKWEIEANIPLSLSEIYYDWRLIDAAKEHRDRLDILVGVLPKKTVDPYLNVLKKAGLKPFVFEIESLAIARALVPGGYHADPLLIIDFGARKTSLVIFSGQTVYFTASLPVSNSSIIGTLSEKLNVDLNKAKQIKIEQGLGYNNPTGPVMKAIEPLLNEMAENIKGYISYYQEHLPVAPGSQNNMINEIIICGGGANFEGLSDFLAEKLKIPISVGNPWTNVFQKNPQSVSDLPPAEAISYTTAVGLAIRGLQE